MMEMYPRVILGPHRPTLFWWAYALYGALVVALNVYTLVYPSPVSPSSWTGSIFSGVLLLPGTILVLLVQRLLGVSGSLPPRFHAYLILLGCLAAPPLLARLSRCWRRGARRRGSDPIRQAAGIEPDWQVIWTGAAAGQSLAHLCPKVTAPATTDPTGRVHLPFALTAAPGIEVAKCGHCRVAWIRAREG